MNKIIITGHAIPCLGEIESLLIRSGMKQALPSRREGLLPREIVASICNAHRPNKQSAPAAGADCQPIQPAPIWSALALDLEIANTEQRPWGWADRRNLALLDFWRELVPQTAFVLAYEDPKSLLLKSALLQADPPDEAEIQKLLEGWAATNRVMLDFYLRHPECSILVDSRRAGHEPAALVELLQRKMNVPLTADHTISASVGNSERPEDAFETTHVAAAENYLVDSYLADRPAYFELYQQLHAAAALPADPAEVNPLQGHVEWDALVSQRQDLARAVCQILQQLKGLQKQQLGFSEEKELMLMQLHHAQEELNCYFREIWELKQAAAKLEQEAVAERIKQQLSYRIGATIVSNSRSLGGLLGMPFALIGEIRSFNKQKRNARKAVPGMSSSGISDNSIGQKSAASSK